MPKFKAVLFDFDGTLVESGPAIFYALRLALQDMKQPVPPDAVLRRLVGPPLMDGFTQMLGMSEEDAAQALVQYRAHYFEKGDSLITLYPGVMEMLDALKSAGVITGIATCKQIGPATRQAALTGIDRRVDLVAGIDESQNRYTKADVLRYCLETLGVGKDEVVMVGDRKYDCEGAIEVGIPCIGVLYGYGSREELSCYHPLLLAKTAEELAGYLLES